MSEPDLQNNFVSRDFHYEVVEAQAKRIAELGAVLQQVVDETAHLDCYSQATTNKILAALRFDWRI